MIGWFKKRKEPQVVTLPVLECEGTFDFDIVGEASYQQALSQIAGPKSEKSKDFQCQAVLVKEDTNAYDAKAVRVEIEERTVGYLSRQEARNFRSWLSKQEFNGLGVVVQARIVGGWKDERSEGYFGVKLDLDLV